LEQTIDIVTLELKKGSNNCWQFAYSQVVTYRNCAIVSAVIISQ